MTAITIQPDTIKFGNYRAPFVGFAEASQLFIAMRDQLGEGDSGTPVCLLLAGKKVVGHIGYNGKVWAGAPRDWRAGAEPLFNPNA